MKKLFTPIIILISLFIILFVLFIKADGIFLTIEEATIIGEEKYLKFLWMVDGAFNSERLKEDFLVNDKKLTNEDKVFTCKYINKKECVGNNFEIEFNKLFSKKIDYEKVYSDGAIYTWITNKDNKYIFNNLNTCNINRMNKEQVLKVLDIENNKVIYEVNNRKFILIYEDNEWKIDTAYYHDLCGMKYYIN